MVGAFFTSMLPGAFFTTEDVNVGLLAQLVLFRWRADALSVVLSSYRDLMEKLLIRTRNDRIPGEAALCPSGN
jgi:hypothetical protein